MAHTEPKPDSQPPPSGHDRRNVMLALTEHALARPNASALQLGDREFTQAQLLSSVLRASEYLCRQGVVEGATVALRLPDLASLALGTLALMRMGATPMPLSPTTTALQVQEFVTEAGAQRVLLEPGTDIPLSCVCVPFSEELINSAGPAPSDAPWVEAPEAPCLLITGSGTTGKPRLMPVTHAQMRARIAMQQNRYAVTISDRLMVVTPLHFSVSIHNMLAALCAGGTSVVWDQRGDLARAIVLARPDVLSLTMMHAEQLLLLRQQDPSVDLGAIRVVTLTSSTISEALRQRLRQELNARLHVVYGTNEVYSATVAYPNDIEELAAGVGRADHGVEVELVDSVDHVVAQDEVGHIRVKTPAQIDGYLNGKDEERFRDGWFYPGDLGRWAPCGQLLLMGRSDEMMIMKGVNIYPAEIELALTEHPAVREAAAFSIRHQVALEMPVCVVALHTGERHSRSELMAYARDRLGPKAPRVLAITASLPRNMQGKPVRAELTALIELALQNDSPPSAERAQAFIRQRHEESKKNGALRPAKQRQRRVGFNFVLPAWPRLDQLRLWRLALEGHEASADCEEAPVDLEVSHMAVLWISEVLRVAETLLLAARAPLFDPIRLLSCKPTTSLKACPETSWHAEIEAPLVEGLSPEILGVALKAALQLETWARDHPASSATEGPGREAFFAWTEQHALAPLRKLVPGGKSSLNVLRAAFDLDVPFSHLGGGIYQLGWGNKAHRINRSSTDHDSAQGAVLTHRKDLTAKLLRAGGLPGAEHELVTNLSDARAAANRIGWPVVVKPADADRGEGVSVDVQAGNFDASFTQAHKKSPSRRVLVERQVAGTCHRVFVAGGKLLYAVKRLPVGVYSDGTHSVSQLIDTALARERAAPPWKRSPMPLLDELALASLAQQDIHQQVVPSAGVFVSLRRIESSAWGGVDQDVTLTIHPENVRIALEASALCGLDVAGVDLISTDITQPWHINGAVINEINFSPLLGEGVISRQHVQVFLSRLLGGDGRIPIEVFVGNASAVTAARQRAITLRKTGLAIALTTHEWTEAPNGQSWKLAVEGLHARIRALVMSPCVGALLVVVQTDELMNRELPLEGVNVVHLIDGATIQCRTKDTEERRRLLLHRLNGWVRAPASI